MLILNQPVTLRNNSSGLHQVNAQFKQTSMNESLIYSHWSEFNLFSKMLGKFGQKLFDPPFYTCSINIPLPMGISNYYLANKELTILQKSYCYQWEQLI